MYYKMDITQFPIVFVDFFNITNDISLDDFLNEWKHLYDKNKTFTLVFDTTHITTDISFIKHSYKMIDFIIEIKKLPPLLSNSIIIVQNNIIKHFLYFIF